MVMGVLMAARERGYIKWNPQKKSLALLTEVKDILTQEREYLPLTIRQIFYRLVARGAIGKTERDYARLCELMNKARRSEHIGFSSIRDDGFTQFTWVGYASYDDWVRDTIADAQSFELDKQANQEVRLVIWCEAGGMAPQLRSFVSGTSIPVVSSGGFDSLSTKYFMACELSKICVQGQSVQVLHIGDYDPSGVSIFNALSEDVAAFAYERFGALVSFERVAVTSEQIDAYDLPTAPPKKTDKRATFTDWRTTQCEALPPATLKAIVLRAVQRYWNSSWFDDRVRQQTEARMQATKMILSLTNQKNG